MYLNEYEAQQLAKERTKVAMREAEHARLVRAVKGPGKVREWRPPLGLSLSSLLALFARPQTGSAIEAVGGVDVPCRC